jgi:hypothetical protein
VLKYVFATVVLSFSFRRSVVFKTVVFPFSFRWSEQFADFLDSATWYLMRRRLQWEAHPQWDGDPAYKLDASKLKPALSLLLQLALPSLHHKSATLKAASMEFLSNAVYVEPDMVLPVIVQRFHEALEARDSVHQLSGSIRALCCASSLSILHMSSCHLPLLMEDRACRLHWCCFVFSFLGPATSSV